MFGRRILATVAFVAACAQAQLTITNPSPSSWWVSASQNTLAWTCNSSPYSSYTVVLTNTNTSILSAPLSLIALVPNYDCSFSVNEQQSSLTPSTTWTLELANSQNLSDVYASSQFEIKAPGSVYPESSPSASAGSATSSAGGATSTSTSKNGAASANYVPVGMSMAAALVLGLVVA